MGDENKPDKVRVSKTTGAALRKLGAATKEERAAAAGLVADALKAKNEEDK